MIFLSANRRTGQVHFVSVLHGAQVVQKNYMWSNVGKMQPDEHVDYVLYGLNVSVCTSMTAEGVSRNRSTLVSKTHLN
jgi:hypothetical protein